MQITIYKFFNSTANAGATADIAGQIKTGANSPMTDPQALNLVAQTAATGAGTVATFTSLGGNLSLSATAVTTGLTAFSTASALLAIDIKQMISDYNQTGTLNSKDALTVLGDVITMSGDAALVTSAIANLNLATKDIAVAADLAGDGLTALGIGIEQLQASGSPVSAASANGLTSAANADIANIQSFLSANTDNATGAFGSLWNSTATSLSTALTSVSGVMSSMGNGSFITNANSAASFFDNTQASLSNLFTSTGVTPQSITETASGNSVAVTGGTGNTPVDTTSLTYSPNGSSVALQTNDPDGSGSVYANGDLLTYAPQDITKLSFTAAGDALVNITPDSGTGTPETIDVSNSSATVTAGGKSVSLPDSPGQPTTINVNSDGGYSATVTSPNGTTTNNYNASDQLLSKSTITGQNATLINYNPANDVVTQQTTVTADSIISNFYDAITGNPIANFVTDQATSVWKQFSFGNTNYNQFQATIANALAAQVISKFVFTNNLPASLAVQAFATTSINAEFGVPASSTTSSTGTAAGFSEQFAQNLTSMAAGIGGGIGGADLAQLLGVPTVIGSTVGNTVSAALTQQLTSTIAQEEFGASIGDVGGSIFNGTLSMTDFTANLGTALETAGFGIAGAEAASLIIGSGNEGAQIGSAIGGTIGGALLGPLGAFVGGFIGDIAGDFTEIIFGGHPSVGPNATSLVQYVNGQYAETYANGDNGGSPVPAQNMAISTANTLNAINSLIGGVIVNASHLPTWGLGYFKGQYFATNETTDPNGYSSNQFANASDAVSSAVLSLLRTEQIQDGNPYMMYMLQKSNATTLQGLISDLNAAHDYSIYIANPAAFDLALAISGNATQYATWQTELARVQALGVNQLPAGYDSNASVVATGANETVYPAGVNDNVYLNGTGETAMATGSSATVYAYGTNSTANLNGVGETAVLWGGGATAYLNASNNTVYLNTSGQTASLLGTGDMADLYVANDVVNLNGNNETASAWGTNDTVYVNGPNNVANLYGGTETVAAFANGDTVYLSGTNDIANLNGVSETAALSGNGASANLYAANGTINLNGANETAITWDNNDTVNIYAASGTAKLYGGSSTVSAWGTGDILYLNGATDTANLDGSNETAAVSGNGDTVYLNGPNDTANFNGTGGTAALSGSGATVNFYAANNTANLNAANETVTMWGTGNIANLYAASDVARLYSASETASAWGTGDTVYLSGTTETANLDGNNETAAVSGNGNTVYLNGTNTTGNFNGTGETAALSGTGATANFYAANGTAYLNSASETVVLWSSGDTANLYATNDSATLDGNNETASAWGANNTVYLVGTGNTVHLYASNESAVVTGGSSTVYGTVGDTISISGSGASGSADTVYLSNGFITVLNSTPVNIIGTGNVITGASGGNTNIGIQNGATDTFTNFRSTDTIDITNQAFTAQTRISFIPNVAGQSGVLEVFNGSTQIDTVNIQGPYISFADKADPSGHLLITDPPVTTPVITASDTQIATSVSDILPAAAAQVTTHATNGTDFHAFMREQMASGNLDLHNSIVGSFLKAQIPQIAPSPASSAMPDEPYRPAIMAAWDTHTSGNSFVAGLQPQQHGLG